MCFRLVPCPDCQLCVVWARLIKALYDSNLPVVNQIMSGKAVTPLPSYWAAVDGTVLNVTVVLVVTAVGLILIRNPLGLALSGLTILAGSLSIFVLLDAFPPLVAALHFDLIPYFYARLNTRPDPELGFLQKPLNHSERTNFRGYAYSPLYGIDEPANTVIVDTDEEGFRNQHGVSSADIVVLGSSFPAYGNDLDDTYTRKLEKQLNGYTVANLGVGGYGPCEFLRVFERFGLPKKPRYAILAFNTRDIEGLKEQVSGEVDLAAANQRIIFGGFWSRWKLALQETWRMLRSSSWTALQRGFQRIVPTEVVHPDVAVLRLPGNRTEELLFLTHHTGLSTQNLLDSVTWRVFEKILLDFKQISERNQIVPLLAYIPFSTEVYAEYSTRESGGNWLSLRESQIATSTNDEEAARRLAEKVGIELISFLPAFKDAARHGELVYYRFDNHWNSKGSEIAARVTSEALKSHIEGIHHYTTAGAKAVQPASVH